MSNSEIPVYEEITQIAHKNAEIKRLIAEIVGEVGWDGFDWIKGNFIQSKANAKAHDKIAQLAKKNQEFQAMIEALSQKIDIEGLDFKTTQFVEDGHEENGQLISPDGHLDNQGFINDTYGTMYFRTATPGLYVSIDFNK